MTNTETKLPRDRLQEIGLRIGDCAGVAAGIDLILMARSPNDEELMVAISGMATILEEHLKRLSQDIELLSYQVERDAP